MVKKEKKETKLLDGNQIRDGSRRRYPKSVEKWVFKAILAIACYSLEIHQIMQKIWQTKIKDCFNLAQIYNEFNLL